MPASLHFRDMLVFVGEDLSLKRVDLLVEDSIISKIDQSLLQQQDSQIIDASSYIAFPLLTDIFISDNQNDGFLTKAINSQLPNGVGTTVVCHRGNGLSENTESAIFTSTDDSLLLSDDLIYSGKEYSTTGAIWSKLKTKVSQLLKEGNLSDTTLRQEISKICFKNINERFPSLNIPKLNPINVNQKANFFLMKLDKDFTAQSSLVDILLSKILYYDPFETIVATLVDGKFSNSKNNLIFKKIQEFQTLNKYYYEKQRQAVKESTNGHILTYQLDSIQDGIEEIKKGNFLIVVDNEDRENEGDLIIAGQDVTPEKMAFMIRYSGGVVCVPTLGSRLDELNLPMMVQKNEDSLKTAYTISLDYKHGTTTGISAHDRALTVRAMATPNPQKNDPLLPSTTTSDFNRPGHVFPLRYTNGGVLTRVGHTEASIDLCLLAGKYPCAAISEVVSPKGERWGLDGCGGDGEVGGMARRDELFGLSREWGIKMVSISDLREFLAERNGRG